MKKIILFIFLLGLGIVLFVSTITNIGIGTIVDSLAQFSPFAFLLFFFISSINAVLCAFRWKIIIDTEGRNVSLGRLTFHSLAGFMMSYLTPATLLSGEPVKIYLLHKAENIPLREGSFSVITDKVLELTGAVIFIFISFLLAVSKGMIGKENMYSLIITVIITALLLISFYWLIVSGKGFFRTIFRFLRCHRIKKIQHWEEKIIHTEQKITSFFTHHKKVFITALVLASLSWSFRILETYTVLFFLGVHLTFTELFIVAFLPMIALLMPIPGGLGLLEGGTAAMMGIMGVNPHLAISLVLISRIRDIIFVAIGLGHTSHYSIRSLLQNIQHVRGENSKE